MKYNERSILVDGKRISYIDVGEGPVVLFLHGIYSVKEEFWGVMGYVNNFRMVALDLPGHGNSEVDYDVKNIRDMVSKVFRFANQLGIKPIMVFGHSLGATIAIELASSDFIRPGTLILHSPLIESKQLKWYFNNILTRTILKMTLSVDTLQEYTEKLIQWAYKREIQPLKQKREHLELSMFVYERSIQADWELFVTLMLNLLNCNYTPDFEKLITPVTILQPEKDTFLKEYYSTENFRNVKKEGGHSIMNNDWEDIAQEIQNVIDDIQRRLENVG